MTQVVFEVRDSEDGGYIARALGQSIHTQGDSLEEIRSNVREAVACHFDSPPAIIRLIFVREETLAA
jgi:predicted RNase H-like HicB family nuclease